MNATVRTPQRGGKRLAARQRARERILAAARKVFSERGFAAAALDRIAAEAGCTKGLVHHYFGSKRRLWESVIDRYAERARNAPPPAASGRDGLERLMARLAASFAFFRRHPDYLRFEAWAELESGARVPESLREIAAELQGLVRQAQRSGAVRGDVDPRHINAMMHNLTAGWFKTRRFFCAMWGRSVADPEVDEAYFADLLRVLRAGLAPAGAPAGRRGRRPPRSTEE